MDKVKDILAVVFGGRLIVDGKDRTFVKVPMWLAVLAALVSPHLLIVTALLIVAFGMHVKAAKA